METTQDVDQARTDFARIEQLITEFAACADRGDAAGLARLFAIDGEFSIGGKVLCGRAQIEAFCRERFGLPGRVTRHAWSNLQVSSSDSGWTASAIQMTFEQAGADAAPEVRVSDLHDTISRSEAGHYLFDQRIIARVMAIQGN